MLLHPTLTGTSPGLGRHRLWVARLMLAASLVGGMLPTQARAASPPLSAASPSGQDPAVLIVSGAPYGLPVSSAMIDGVVDALKAKGVCRSDRAGRSAPMTCVEVTSKTSSTQAGARRQ